MTANPLKDVSKPFLITFVVAIGAIAGLIWYGFATTKGNHLAPTGKIAKVRTVKAGDDATFMVIDFDIMNDSDRAMVVHTLETTIEMPDGATATGQSVAASDMGMAFKNYSLLGEQFNPVLKERDVIPPHQQVGRMVGVSFDVPYDKVEARKQVTVRIEDATGPVLEMTK